MGEPVRGSWSEGRLGRVLDRLPEAVLVMDRGLRVTHANSFALSILGLRLNEILGSSLWDVLPHLRDTAAWWELDNVFLTQTETRFTYHSVLTGRWLEARAFPEGDEVVLHTTDLSDARAAEARLEAIADAAPVLVAYLDSELRYRFCNEAYEPFFGLARDAILGRSVEELVGAAAFAAVGPRFERALSGEEVSYSAWVEYAVGGRRYVRAVYRPDLDPKGRVRGLFAFVVDETEQRLAEEALGRTEARQRFLLDLGDEMRREGSPREIVRIACRLVGTRLGVARCGYAAVYPEVGRFVVENDYVRAGSTSISGNYLLEDVDEAQLARHRAGLPTLIEDAATDPLTAARYETVFGPLAIRSSASIPILKGGEWLGTFDVQDDAPRAWSDDDAALLAEVASRVWDAIERARAERDAIEREARYRGLANGVPVMVWTAGADGSVDFVNDRWRAYFQVGDKKALGYSWIAVVHPDDRASTAEAWARSVREGTPYSMEYRLRRHDGAYRWHLCVAQPERREGELTGWIGSIVDVDEQRAREAALNLLVELGDRTRELFEPRDVMRATMALLSERLSATRCVYAEVGEDGDSFRIVDDNAQGLPSIVGEYRLADFGREVLAQQRAGRSTVVADVRTASETAEHAAGYESIGIRAFVSVPLVKAGALVAIVSVHQSEARAWTASDVELVGMVADRCWSAIERARAERALSESAAQDRQIAEGLPQLVWSAAPDGQRDYFNGRWLEYTGVGLGESESPWLACLHPDDRERASSAWKGATDGGETFQAEYRLRGRDGLYRWFLGRAIPLRGESGAVARWFGTCTDIDEQKTAQSALEASNRFARTLGSDLDPARIVQALTDASTEAVGAEFGSFFYARPEDEPGPDGGERFGLYVLSGAPLEAFSSFPPVRVTPLFAPTFLGEGVVRSDDVATDARYRGMPAGHLPVRSYLAVPVRARDGAVLGGLLFGHPEPRRFTLEHERLVASFATQASVAYENAILYERLRDAKDGLERRVAERTEELTRANRDLNEFSYSVAHDLRAPLRAIVSTSRILLEDEGGRLSEEGRQSLERQATNAIRLAKIVDDLLGFARLAKAEVRRQEVDVTDLARRVAREVEGRRAAACETQVQEGMRALGDADLLGYALTNLIDNACKFSEGRGGVEVGERGGAFFVRDEGVGFDMRHAHKLFTAFERLVGQESFEGTGVGLANVKRIVERHGGRIWAESELGKGATFWFTLG